ncbi:hypothetical protein [Nocardia sp. CA-120079]|uniref:hypothetical protein n=1 Tax=Nocardia sp. CA-120079 TaxID=3239974 RepID=UPI003D99F844
MSTVTHAIEIKERETVTVPINGANRVPYKISTRFKIGTEIHSVNESLFTVFATGETGMCRHWKVVFDYHTTKETARRLAKLLGYDDNRIEKWASRRDEFICYGIRW